MNQSQVRLMESSEHFAYSLNMQISNCYSQEFVRNLFVVEAVAVDKYQSNIDDDDDDDDDGGEDDVEERKQQLNFFDIINIDYDLKYCAERRKKASDQVASWQIEVVWLANCQEVGLSQKRLRYRFFCAIQKVLQIDFIVQLPNYLLDKKGQHLTTYQIVWA